VSLKSRRDAGTLKPAQSDVFLAPRPEVELYNLKNDPHQLHNLAGRKELTAQQKNLTGLLKSWMQATHDSVPQEISHDSFDRETGQSLKVKSYRRTTPGEDRGATRVNRPGPR